MLCKFRCRLPNNIIKSDLSSSEKFFGGKCAEIVTYLNGSPKPATRDKDTSLQEIPTLVMKHVQALTSRSRLVILY